jgi:cell division protein FtsZ
MAVGRGTGEDRAKIAAEQAISSQLLDITIDGARGVLFNVTGGTNLTLFEVNQAAAIIRETAHPDVNMIFGAVIEPDMGDEVRVTVIATGFERSGVPRRALERLSNGSNRSAAQGAGTPASGVFLRTNESVSVGAELRPAAGSNSSAAQANYGGEDLDIPTFLRNRGTR